MNNIQNKVLIANRGEIAVRAIRTCKELGLGSVAIYSTADRDSLHVKLADQAICIGGAKSSESYLNISNILSAAIATGCNAIFPGYGFLSENDKFAEIVEKCGLKFVGPSSEVIRKIGNKSIARKIAQEAGIPIIAGSEEVIANKEEGVKIAKEIGYPLLIKAVSGGGGKGICLVENEEEFIKKYEITSQEAKANFGNETVYLEKYLVGVRHVEFQILADHFGNVVHLGERDCSIQRRNQKMVEEAPSQFINAELRKKMGEDAIKYAKAIHYENAGTVEFIVDKDSNYYFIEMNARVQVEHPVTEMITGIDIVKEQLRIGFQHPLPFQQEDIVLKGHAIECRINAEDHLNNFRPSPGQIKNIVFPGGFDIRIDTHIYNNYFVPPYYDSLLAKLIVHAPTRKEAIRKMRVALEQFIITGIHTNIEFCFLLMHEPDYVRGGYDTNFINGFVKLVLAKSQGD